MINDILWPVLALGGLGIVLGVLLAVASKKFAIDVDPRVGEVRELLAGANCGACGFPGCDGLANALVDGTAKPADCPVTKADNKAAIAAVLGIEVGSSEPTAARVRCNGGVNCKNRYDYIGIKTCRSAKLVAGGPKQCVQGCIGFGDCAAACEFGAIEVGENGVAVVNSELCTSCTKCVAACPNALIEIAPLSKPVRVRCRNTDAGKVTRQVCASGCIGCGLCKKQCQSDAITIENNRAWIDPEKCTTCGACAVKCPTSAIFPKNEAAVKAEPEKAAAEA